MTNEDKPSEEGMEELVPASTAGEALRRMPSEERLQRPEHTSKTTLYCSFCGKSQHEVKKLIAGPTVFICDECTELCQDIIVAEGGIILTLTGLHELAGSRWAIDPDDVVPSTRTLGFPDVPAVLRRYQPKLAAAVANLGMITNTDSARERQKAAAKIVSCLIALLQFSGFVGISSQEIGDEIRAWARERQK